MNHVFAYLNRMSHEDRVHFIELVRYQSQHLTAVHQQNDRIVCLLALAKLEESYPQCKGC